ncbi:molybdopterin converting factor, large subunit [Corynebacterium renale]|uniref:Molybdopterin synthase subunit MoaE n=1 Tax=Corynebacterium renale TaxID=1724 RepID=A0A2A9DQ93_9CORY|nr:molybdopterin synthase subunit MoaE [Corynebacterium renale]SQI25544.1 molybdopterin converting factor, large subunit [Corynebacterium renale]
MSINNDPAYVAEQTGKVISARMTTQPLEELQGEARSATVTEAMGALVTFEGIVRDHDGGQRVKNLTYTAHPSAQQEIEAVVARISAEHPNTRMWVAHRTGPLTIGEIAFLVLVASAHRGDAFAACSAVADAVKAEVPIWKEQELLDGSAQWVGLE